jgi:hypothetical protein
MYLYCMTAIGVLTVFALATLGGTAFTGFLLLMLQCPR